MSFGETRINLKGVLELDRGFRVLAFVEVVLAALHVHLLLFVGSLAATRQQRRQHTNRHHRILKSERFSITHIGKRLTPCKLFFINAHAPRYSLGRMPEKLLPLLSQTWPGRVAASGYH